MPTVPSTSLNASERDRRVLSVMDGCTEVLLYAMIIFSPWAFGTTEPWSMRWMNAGGYALGALLIGKILLRRRAARNSHEPRPHWLRLALFALTLGILGY